MIKLFQKGCLFGALLLFSHCEERSMSKVSPITQLNLLDSLELEMPLEFLSLTKWTSYSFKEGVHLVEYGLFRNEGLVIHRIDFEQQKYLRPIKIPTEGPDGFNSSNASIFFQDENSIFLFPTGSKRFYKYDTLGQKKMEFEYNSEDNGRFFTTGYYTTAIEQENTFVISTINDTRYDDPNYYKKVFPVSQLDLTSGEFIKKIPYPANLSDQIFPSNLVGATVSNFQSGEVLINYCFSDSLFTYNFRENSIESIYCGLEGWDQPKSLQVHPDRFESLEYQAKELNYQNVFFHEGKIYRLVSHLKDDDYRELSISEILKKNLRELTLIQLDPEEDIINYYKMPLTKYFLFDENKLYVGGISVREEGEESYRTFYIYSLDTPIP